jgi:putative transcriptional regulator
MTQGALAERTHVSRQTVNSVELGKFVPSTVLALRMSAVFGIPVNELFELEESDWD